MQANYYQLMSYYAYSFPHVPTVHTTALVSPPDTGFVPQYYPSQALIGYRENVKRERVKTIPRNYGDRVL